MRHPNSKKIKTTKKSPPPFRIKRIQRRGDCSCITRLRYPKVHGAAPLRRFYKPATWMFDENLGHTQKTREGAIRLDGINDFVECFASTSLSNGYYIHDRNSVFSVNDRVVVKQKEAKGQWKEIERRAGFCRRNYSVGGRSGLSHYSSRGGGREKLHD